MDVWPLGRTKDQLVACEDRQSVENIGLDLPPVFGRVAQNANIAIPALLQLQLQFLADPINGTIIKRCFMAFPAFNLIRSSADQRATERVGNLGWSGVGDQNPFISQ